MPLNACWGLYDGLLIGIIYPHFASPVDCKLFEGRDGDAIFRNLCTQIGADGQ